MKTIKATFAKDFRNIDGVNLFDKFHVIYVSARCTTHGQYTGYVFGSEDNIIALLKATPTSWRKLHHNGQFIENWESQIPYGIERYNAAIKEGQEKGWF